MERIVVDLLLNFFTAEQLNAFFTDPQTVSIILGILVSLSTAVLGVFLLLRKMSLTSDAISHTVLLGIVVAFLILDGFGSEADISSPWLLIGAGAAGVMTVIVTELIYRSGLVKADAALGLTLSVFFAIAVILISQNTRHVHLDQDAVLTGSIEFASANTTSHCIENCETVVITPDDPRAETARRCINCTPDSGISPRSDEAVFEEFCTNCGEHTPGEAWKQKLIDVRPILVFIPKSLSVLFTIAVINLAFVLAFYKELKLSTFDSSLAAALGFRPGWLTYMLMILVSITAVGAFDSVGSILVVAFFIIPAATAYLLTDRLSGMLVLAPLFGAIASIFGFVLARGSLFFIIDMESILEFLDRTVGLDGFTTWETSIAASMVIVSLILFILTWVFSPRYGLVAVMVQRRTRANNFSRQLLMRHIYNHQGQPNAEAELSVANLHEHLRWSPERVQQVMRQVQAANWVDIENGIAILTEQGEQQVQDFYQKNLVMI